MKLQQQQAPSAVSIARLGYMATWAATNPHTPSPPTPSPPTPSPPTQPPNPPPQNTRQQS